MSVLYSWLQFLQPRSWIKHAWSLRSFPRWKIWPGSLQALRRAKSLVLGLCPGELEIIQDIQCTYITPSCALAMRQLGTEEMGRKEWRKGIGEIN